MDVSKHTDGLQWKTLLTWMIWRVPLFLETPIYHHISVFILKFMFVHHCLTACDFF